MRTFTRDRRERFFEETVLLGSARQDPLASFVLVNGAPLGDVSLDRAPEFSHRSAIHEVGFDHTGHLGLILHRLCDRDRTRALLDGGRRALRLHLFRILGRFGGSGFSLFEHGDGDLIDVHPESLTALCRGIHVFGHVFVRLDRHVCLGEMRHDFRRRLVRVDVKRSVVFTHQDVRQRHRITRRITASNIA